MTIEHLENRTTEFIIKEYLTTISESISNCQFRGNGTMLFLNGFTLGIIWNNNSFYPFNSHSRNSSGNPAIDGTAILSKFNSLLHIDEYIRKMNFENVPLFTFRFSLFELFAPWKTFQTFKLTLKQNNKSENTRKIVHLKKCKQKQSITKIHQPFCSKKEKVTQ